MVRIVVYSSVNLTNRAGSKIQNGLEQRLMYSAAS